MGIVSAGYAGTVNEIQWASMMPTVGASEYGVVGVSDWKVSIVPGQDRTVSINPGTGWGYGVLDTLDTAVTVQLDPVASGTRWDMIVMGRNWSPPSGATSPRSITGTTTRALPTRLTRTATSGAQDDQPLALVQLTAGQSQPTAIVDLRCWAGGGATYAKDDLVKSYLSRVGTRLVVNGAGYVLLPGPNDISNWVGDQGANVIAPLTVPDASVGGTLTTFFAGALRMVTVDLTITAAKDRTLIHPDLTRIGPVLPGALRSQARGKYLPVSFQGYGESAIGLGALTPSSGELFVRGPAKMTWRKGVSFGFNTTYTF